MKKLAAVLLILIFGTMLFGCKGDDTQFGEHNPTMVWGDFFCDACTGSLSVDGTLGEGSEDYYGYCHRTDTGLSFVVAEKDPTADDFTDELYFEVIAIEGPPSTGVYEEGETTFDDPSLYTTFSSIKIMNTNVWYFHQSDVPNQDLCYVRLFAEPADGELTPAEYGSNSFEYFVYIICTGINEQSPQGATLNSISMMVWFDACEEI